MRNLKNYNALELSNKEMRSINGGFLSWIVGAFIVLAAFALGNAIGNSCDSCDQ